MRIEYKTGAQRNVRDTAARHLIRAGIAREVRISGSNTYQTRQMLAAEPQLLTITPNADGLDGLDIGQLRALAADRGVSVHARAGADKIRAALRDAK